MREDIESLDYDIDSSSIFEQDLQQQSAQYRSCQAYQRWAVCAAIGCTTGAVAFLIDVLTAQLLQAKYSIAAAAMRYLPEGNDAGPFFAVLGAYVALSVLCVAISAALVVFVEPVAGALCPSGCRAAHRRARPIPSPPPHRGRWLGNPRGQDIPAGRQGRSPRPARRTSLASLASLAQPAWPSPPGPPAAQLTARAARRCRGCCGRPRCSARRWACSSRWAAGWWWARRGR